MAWTFVPDIPYDDTAARRGWWPLRWPWRDRLRHKEFRLNSGKAIRQTGEVQILRNHSMLQREDRLHQPQCSGGRLAMSEIGLHRCERAGAVDPVYLGQARVFDGVADRGTGAVRLHHADGAGVHARGSQRRPVHRDLRVHATVSRCSRYGHPDWRPCRAPQPGSGHHPAAHPATA